MLGECGDCKHLHLGRCGALENTGANWCELLNRWRFALEQPDCEHFDRRTCGNCVVYNGDQAAGACSIMGPRTFDQAPCRRWFGKAQLSAPLYGAKQRA